MDSKVAATLRVLIDGQAYIYALYKRQQAGEAIITEADFQSFQDEWKQETAALIEQMLTGESPV